MVVNRVVVWAPVVVTVLAGLLATDPVSTATTPAVRVTVGAPKAVSVGDQIGIRALVTKAKRGYRASLQRAGDAGWVTLAEESLTEPKLRWRLVLTTMADVDGPTDYRVVVEDARDHVLVTSRTLAVTAYPTPPPSVDGQRQIRDDLFLLDIDGSPQRAPDKVVVDKTVVSGEGNAVVYRAYHQTRDGARDYSLEWRELATGRARSIPNVWAYDLDMSADGRWVVFTKASRTASSGQVTSLDFTLWDTSTGKRTPLDVLPDGKAARDGDGTCWSSSVDISDNGDWVVFSSDSIKLQLAVPGHSFAVSRVYAYERATGRVHYLPWPSGWPGTCPRVSDTGRVAFSDGTGEGPVYLWDIGSDGMRELWLPEDCATSDGGQYAISADGSRVAGGVGRSVWVMDIGSADGDERLVYEQGCVYSDESGGDDIEYEPAISADGSRIAYLSEWTNPDDWQEVPLGGGNYEDVYVGAGVVSHLVVTDVDSGQTRQLSPAGDVPWLFSARHGNQGIWSYRVSMTADGQSLVTSACTKTYVVDPIRGCTDRSDILRWLL